VVAESEYGLAVIAERSEPGKREEDVLVAVLLAALAEEVPFPLFADRSRARRTRCRFASLNAPLLKKRSSSILLWPASGVLMPILRRAA
jgi:hypothetical protein